MQQLVIYIYIYVISPFKQLYSNEIVSKLILCLIRKCYESHCCNFSHLITTACELNAPIHKLIILIQASVPKAVVTLYIGSYIGSFIVSKSAETLVYMILDAMNNAEKFVKQFMSSITVNIKTYWHVANE